MQLKNTHNPYDAFCIYCQKPYASVIRLNTHIKRMHHGTIAYWSLIEAEEAAMLSQIDKEDF